MDRNEKQNSYKNMVSSRGRNREIIKLKRRFRVLTVLIVLLLLAVICMGILVGRMYQEVRIRGNGQQEPGGGSQILTEAIPGTETESETESETEPEQETEEATENSTKPAFDTEAGTKLPENQQEMEELTEEEQEIEILGTNALQNKISQVLSEAFPGEGGYSCYVERKKPGETQFREMAKVENGREWVESDKLAYLFVVGKVYQYLNDSYSDVKEEGAAETTIWNPNNDLKKYSLALLGRSDEMISDESHALETLLERIGAVYAGDSTYPEGGKEQQQEYGSLGLEGVRTMLEEKPFQDCKTNLPGFGTNGQNVVYLEDVLDFMKYLETDDIWRNDNQDYGAGGEAKIVTTRDNLKSVLSAPYAQENSGSALRLALEDLFEGYTVCWIEDVSQQNHIALLMEKKSGKEASDCILVGLYAPETENQDWSEKLARAIKDGLGA